MTLNALDGMLARECNQKTRLGAILNETGDVISDIALYLPFLFLPESNASLVILMLFCTILTELCGLLAQTINGIRSYAGPFGKSDCSAIGSAKVVIYPQWMQWNNLLWSIASISCFWTAIDRCRSVLFMSAERYAEKSLATLFALLILATLINRFLVWRLPERKGGEVTLRIRTWWGIVICFSMVISGPRWMTLTFFALISFLALKEYCTLISVHFSALVILGYSSNYLLIGFNCFELFLLFIPLAGFLILATWRVLWVTPPVFCIP